MKIKRIIICVALLSLLGALGLMIGSSAQTTDELKESGSTPAEQSESKTVEEKSIEASPEDFYTAGQNVDVKSKKPVGDVAVAGSTVTLSDKAQGYVMAAGSNVNINAPVGNDLWAAGASVIVNAPVADNAMLAGSLVVLESNAGIGRDARIAANNVNVKGNVARNLYVAASSAEISSEIAGNAEVYTVNLMLKPGAIVRGNLTVYGPNQPVISPGAKVLGKTDFHNTESAKDGRSYSSAIGNWFGNWFLSFLWIAVVGLAAVWFSSVWTNRVSETLWKATGKSFLVGLIVVLAAPILFVLLLISFVGLPLAFLLGAMALVAFLLSGAFVSYLAGDLLLKQLNMWQTSDVLKIVFGAMGVAFVMSLPWIGWPAKLAVTFFGVGAFLLERRDLLGKMRAQGLA